MKAGKALEQLVAEIRKYLGNNSDVEHNYPLTDVCGVKREIDVLVKISNEEEKQVIAFECKDYKNKVGIKEVEAFVCKCHDLPEIHKGIMVSSHGFTIGAQKKAQYHGIELHPLNDVPYAEILRIADVYRLKCKIEIPLPFYLVVGEKNLYIPYQGQNVYDLTNDSKIQLEGKILTSFTERVSSIDDQLKARHTNTAQLPYTFIPPEKLYLLDADNNKHIIKLCFAIINVTMNSQLLDVTEQKLYAANDVRVSKYAQTDGNSLLLINDEKQYSAFLQDAEGIIHKTPVIPQK